MVKHWNRLPEKSWISHPWKCARPGWMELWANSSCERCPCPQQGSWDEIDLSPSKPFCDFVKTSLFTLSQTIESKSMRMATRDQTQSHQDQHPICTCACSWSSLGEVQLFNGIILLCSPSLHWIVFGDFLKENFVFILIILNGLCRIEFLQFSVHVSVWRLEHPLWRMRNKFNEKLYEKIILFLVLYESQEAFTSILPIRSEGFSKYLCYSHSSSESPVIVPGETCMNFFILKLHKYWQIYFFISKLIWISKS